MDDEDRMEFEGNFLLVSYLEGRTRESLARFPNGKNRGSRITDHGYKNLVFPNHENKRVGCSF